MTVIEGLYSVGMMAGSIIAGPCFYFHPRGRPRLSERYGSWALPAGRYIWFHGASVGELNGLAPLVKTLRGRFPDEHVLMTSTTTSGLDSLNFPDIQCRLLPFDHPLWLLRALRGVEVSRFIFGETELWPALLKELSARGVRSYMVNARISDYTLKRYLALRSIVSPALQRVDWILASTEQSAERFCRLGAEKSTVVALGNAKYDCRPADLRPQIERLKNEVISGARPLVVLGSLRPGEEVLWFQALADMRDLKLDIVVAPRHSEKFEWFAQRLNDFNLRFQLRSRMNTPAGEPSGLNVVLLDTMGELSALYALARLAFVGGTLVDIGGHNPVEAIAHGVPTVFGPYVSVIREIVVELEKKDACLRVSSVKDICELLKRVVAGDPHLSAIGEAGIEIAERNRGATERIVDKILSNG